MKKKPKKNKKCKIIKDIENLLNINCSEIDLDIYRILVYKRNLISNFLQEKLPYIIHKEAEKLNIKKYKGTIVDNFYEKIEINIYKNIYNFFSRCTKNGGYVEQNINNIEKEVFLYWNKRDQYYVKSEIIIRDYTYKAPNKVNVYFKIKKADLVKNKTGNKNLFCFKLIDNILWDNLQKTLVIPLCLCQVDKETDNYEDKNTKETMIYEIVKNVYDFAHSSGNEEIFNALFSKTYTNKKEDEQKTLLEYHLHSYLEKYIHQQNSFDIFIHKDLQSFLIKELDFYINNEMLNLSKLENKNEHSIYEYIQFVTLFKYVTLHIIELLTRIENLQKLLWEKKKFITETFYVITVGNVPECFYSQIVSCEKQWSEWESLGFLETNTNSLLSYDLKTEKGRINFLKAFPNLPLDTRNFSKEFTDELLTYFDNLDDIIDGLQVQSDNWQALNILKEKYQEKVKCIYIDPPYNTGNTHFIYDDNYQRSSWLTMMSNRLELVKNFMKEDGVLFISIDDNEYDNLKKLADTIITPKEYLNTFVWINNLKGRQISGRGAVNTHEYILCFGGKKVKKFTVPANQFNNIMPSMYKTLKHDVQNDSFGFYVLKNELYNTNSKFNEQTRPNLVFNIHYNFATGEIRFSEVNENVDYLEFIKIPPKPNKDGIHRFHAWRWSKKKIIQEKENLEFIKTKDGVKIYTKVRNFQVTALKDIISDISTSCGTKEISNLFGILNFTSYPKPTKLIEVLASQTRDKDLICDFFAGSGTTGHAIINLNREDEGNRKFILIEKANYFDNILLQRIKKVIFTPEWKDGKPKRIATPKETKNTPRIIKVIRLESYEDTINNLDLSEENKTIKNDYNLFYFLDKNREELKMNLDRIKEPFSCKIKLQINGTIKEHIVDLPETFNYILGLYVENRKIYYNNNQKYLIYRGKNRERKCIVVIWRETKKWTEKNYKIEKEFIEKNNIVKDADEIFVNDYSLIENSKLIEQHFLNLMFSNIQT